MLTVPDAALAVARCEQELDELEDSVMVITGEGKVLHSS